MSLPAGTGVCVVKTVPAATASRAAAKSRWFSSISRRMRSSPQKAEWPSFMWQTVGALPTARRARTPPMPRIISWRTRMSLSPPYSRPVMPRSSGLFCGMFVSSRYSGMRPTWIRQTRACTSRPGNGTETSSAEPSLRVSGTRGRLKKSFSGYFSCCQPSTLRYWRK